MMAAAGGERTGGVCRPAWKAESSDMSSEEVKDSDADVEDEEDEAAAATGSDGRAD